MRPDADSPPGRRSIPAQPVDAVANQDPVDRRRRDVDDAGQAGGTELAGLAQRQDAPLDAGGVPMRAGVRPPRPVDQAGGAPGDVAPPPLGSGRREMFIDSAVAATDHPSAVR